MTASNRELVSRFLSYLDKTRQNDPKSVDLRRVHLRRLLLWVGETPLYQAQTIEPIFPRYLSCSEGENTHAPLSPRFIADVCISARAFFAWCQRNQIDGFTAIPSDWIECLRPARGSSTESVIKDNEYFSLEEVRKLLAVEPVTMADERGQAAAAFMFLSGMRIKAFLTLPISCVDLENSKIYQLPSRGVATKFHKAAVTSLLNIPDLLEVVSRWDHKIRALYPPNQTWYAPIRPQRENPGYLHITDNKASPNRDKGFRKELRRLCDMAGILYRSPHKFRHGHAIYGITHARDMKELKALSQNLMHSSISITDGLYGNMASDNVAQVMQTIGAQPAADNANIARMLQELIQTYSNLPSS